MNNEQAKSVDIIFNRGLRQDLDPHTAPPGSLVSCQNLEFDQLGRLVKRDGYALVGATVLAGSGSLLTQVRRFAQTPNGSRLIFSDSAAFLYFPQQDRIAIAEGTATKFFSFRASMSRVDGVTADNNGNLAFSDALAVGAQMVCVYTRANASGGGISVWADVIDIASGGSRILARVSLGVTAGNYPPRLVLAGGSSTLFALWEHSDAITIKYKKLDLSVTPIAWGATTNLITTSGPCVFDACQMDSGWAFVYYDTGTNSAVVKTYDATPAQTHTYTWLANAGALTWTPTALAISGNAIFTGSNVRVVGYDPATQFLESKILSSALASVADGRTNPGLGATKHIRQLAAITTSTTGSTIAFSNYTSGAITTNPRGHTQVYSVADSGALARLHFLSNYSLASRFYMDSVARDQTLLFVARFDDPSGLQNHFALFDLGIKDGFLTYPQYPAPVCSFASGRIPLKSDNANTGIGGIADLSSVQAGLFRFAAVVNIGASQYSGNQVQSWEFQALGTQRFLSAQCQGETYIGGAVPFVYDGQGFGEQSFFSYPVLQSGNVTPSAAGGSIAQGVYQYRAVYEWTDANGNRQQSPASPAITVDLSSGTYVAGTASVAFSVPSLAATYKGFGPGVVPATAAGVQVVFYRTLAGGTIFYRVPGGAPNTPSSASEIPSTFTDTYADASISGNEPIYTSNGGQGLLSSTAPPPSIVLTTHAGRLWGVDCENPERIWCTRTLQPGSAPAYNPGLQILIPGAGRINGLAGQDGKLYALATNGIYLATYGDGPDDTGQGAFPSPELITSTANCQDPRGVLVGQEGIFFTGNDQWGMGIYLIRRGDGTPISIGKRVRNELAAHPVCRGVVNRTGKARTEFLFVDSDTSPTSGVALYYHHDYVDDEGVGQWTTVPHVAIEALGVWDDQSVIAFAGTTNVAWQKVGTPLDPGNSDPVTLVETADIRPAGLLGFAQVTGVSMLGTQAAADPIKIEFSYDSGFSYPDTYQWTASTESVGQPVIRRREPVTQKQFDGSTIRLRLSNPQLGGAAPGQTYLHGISIEIASLGGNARLDAARRS